MTYTWSENLIQKVCWSFPEVSVQEANSISAIRSSNDIVINNEKHPGCISFNCLYNIYCWGCEWQTFSFVNSLNDYFLNVADNSILRMYATELIFLMGTSRRPSCINWMISCYRNFCCLWHFDFMVHFVCYLSGIWALYSSP